MKSHHKVIVLVFASGENGVFRYFRKCWLNFHQSHPDVKVFFVYAAKSGQNADPWNLCYEDIAECHANGTIKVIRAIEHIDKHYTCDYFVHTNLSTFWDFPKLIRRLDSMAKPFLTSSVFIPANPPGGSGYMSFKKQRFSHGYNMIFDGQTLNQLAKYKTDILNFVYHRLTRTLFGGMPEDMLLSVYLMDVFKLELQDSWAYCCPFGDLKDANGYITDDQISERITEAISRNCDHYRVKTAIQVPDRKVNEIRIFNALMQRFYGLSVSE